MQHLSLHSMRVRQCACGASRGQDRRGWADLAHPAPLPPTKKMASLPFATLMLHPPALALLTLVGGPSSPDSCKATDEAAVAALRRTLSDPDRASTSRVLAQVWGAEGLTQLFAALLDCVAVPPLLVVDGRFLDMWACMKQLASFSACMKGLESSFSARLLGSVKIFKENDRVLRVRPRLTPAHPTPHAPRLRTRHHGLLRPPAAPWSPPTRCRSMSASGRQRAPVC